MAIWQYKFYVLPRECMNNLNENFQLKLTDEGFNDDLYWGMYPLKRSFFYNLNSLLTKNKSWSENIDLYGDQDSNCFEVFSENEEVFSVSFRIDFRSNYEFILSHIIEFCGLNGFIVLDENLNIIPWDFNEVQKVIQNSPQVKKYNELSGGNISL